VVDDEQTSNMLEMKLASRPHKQPLLVLDVIST
jgi:hypothetical protein